MNANTVATGRLTVSVMHNRGMREVPTSDEKVRADIMREVSRAKSATAGGSAMQGWTVFVRRARVGGVLVRVEVESGFVRAVGVNMVKTARVPAGAALAAVALLGETRDVPLFYLHNE